MASSDEIFEKVRETLADVLGLVEDEITLDASLVTDFVVDVAEFPDIVRGLEQRFHTTIPGDELFPEDLPTVDSSWVERGLVTEDGLEQLRERMPYADVDKFAEDPRVEYIRDLFTVKMIVDYIEAELPRDG